MFLLVAYACRYLKYRYKTYMRKKNKREENEDYQIDFDLSRFEDQFMFWEYLQVGGNDKLSKCY